MRHATEATVVVGGLAVVRRMAQFDVAGASVFTGMMGFGPQHRIHRKRLFGVSDERPVAILVVEREEKLREILPNLRPLAPDAVFVLLNAELIA